MADLFHLPLSEQAWQEYEALQVIIQEIQITEQSIERTDYKRRQQDAQD
jgi:hypothetical protein